MLFMNAYAPYRTPATRSPYSHAACYIGDGYIVKSDWGGVHIVDLLNKYKNTETDVYRHILQGYEENYMKKVVNWMCHKSGLGYDYGGLVGIALSLINRPKCGCNPYDDKDKYWCSELVADGYNFNRYPTDFDVDTWKVSPADFSNSRFFSYVGSLRLS